MIIESLKFRVNPEVREKFIEHDQKIWTSLLAKCPGFLGKEVWINPHQVDEVTIVVRWQTREEWKEICEDMLKKTEQLFNQEIGAHNYKILASLEHHVCQLVDS